MFKNLLFSAVGAGVAVALCVTVIQAFTTEPLILGAEVFEKADVQAPAMTEHASEAAAPISTAAAASPAHVHEEGAWEPADGLERTLYTMLANLLVGIAA